MSVMPGDLAVNVGLEVDERAENATLEPAQGERRCRRSCLCRTTGEGVEGS